MTHDHKDEQDMLDDYVRNRLAEDDRRQVESAVQADPRLAAELAVLKSLSGVLREDASDGLDPEFGWRRLSRAIDGEARPPHSVAPDHARWWRYAAALLGVVVLGQALLLFGGRAPFEQEARFEFASEQTPAAPDPMLIIAFQPDATEASIRALLDETGGRIADGPSANALYRIAFETGEARDHALIILQEADSTVQYANLP